MDIQGSGARIGLRHHQHVPSQYRSGGHGSEVREGMVWRWGEGKAYSRVPAQILLGKMSCWDDMPPKRGNDELEPLGACHEGSKRE